MGKQGFRPLSPLRIKTGTKRVLLGIKEAFLVPVMISTTMTLQPTFRSFGQRYFDYYLLHLLLVLSLYKNRGET